MHVFLMLAVFFLGVILTNLSAGRTFTTTQYDVILPFETTAQEYIESYELPENQKFLLSLDDKELTCLYKNVFYEAGVEDHRGKIAVAQVTINRLNSGRWGDSICEVVFKHRQFSWTLIQKSQRAPMKGELWEGSKRAVHDFLSGTRIPELEKSLFYHATWLERKIDWVDPSQQVAVLGQHVFYNNDRKR